jgi:hypothetical protein
MDEKISAHLFNPDTQTWNQIYGAVRYTQGNVFFYTDRGCGIADCIGDAKSMKMRILKKGMFLYTFIVSSPWDDKTTELKTDRFTAKKMLSALGL